MYSPSKRIIGIDEDWDQLISLGILKEGQIDGIIPVTDGVKWGAKDWHDKPIIPIQYDSVELDEFQYLQYHIVCMKDNKYDIYYEDGSPKAFGLSYYNHEEFDVRYFICLANSYKRGGRCIAGVEVDYFPYTIHDHNVTGIERVHLWNKIAKFHEEHLK